jgi:hypothetical protein
VGSLIKPPTPPNQFPIKGINALIIMLENLILIFNLIITYQDDL